MRTFVERWYYKRYIERIRWFAEKPGSGVTFIVPEGSLVDAKNYALDTTHLSVEGHKAYADFIQQIDAVKRLIR